MRNRFEQQMEIGLKAIDETPVMEKSRDQIPALIKALLKIYTTPEYNKKIYDLLEEKIQKGKKHTGRKGLNLWQIFVLAQFRLGLNLSYDRLHHMANYDSALRQLLGIERESGYRREEIGYQRILDNMKLLDEETLVKINEVIIELGHKEVFKKKEEAALDLKTDSFVVESNVHFPTDYNLLWDSSRKALDTIKWFKKKYGQIKNWRKLEDWHRELKKLSRLLGNASKRGGKNREQKLRQTTRRYLTKAKALKIKIIKTQKDIPVRELTDELQMLELYNFIELMDKHIDLVERRILKGEKIPHEEKLFSIFEQYTEWITKGKSRPKVELGKTTSITTDQYGLIVDYKIHEKETDSQVVKEIADRIKKKYKIGSWSFDKGYWSQENKKYLQAKVLTLVMPKKGKPNKKEYEEEHTRVFKSYRNKHSAIESNINELEHRGLNRCPDRGYLNFKKYIALSVISYNLHKIGKELIKQARKKKKKTQKYQATTRAA